MPLLLALLLTFLPEPPAARADETVALVCWLQGEVAIRPARRGPAADERWQPLRLYDRLAAVARIRTGEGSAVTVVFFDGQRFVIEASSRAWIMADGVRAESGSVRRLESVPALVEIPRLAHPGRKAGADRIRNAASSGGQPFELYPRDAAIRVEDAVLRYASAPGVDVYRLEIIDAGGREVFAAETAATSVRVPGDRLTPGAVYYWRVSAAERGLLGGAFFETLSADVDRAWRRLAEQATAGDPSLLLLLAEVERGLGLRREACTGLPEAVLSGLDTAAREWTLARFECGGWDRGVAREAKG
jgi:hypothetical protein